jgi:hypothetical protein
MVEDNRQPDEQPRPGRWVRRLGLGLALVLGLRAALSRPAAPTTAVPGEDNRPPPGGLLHPEVRYERSDANFRWIFGILLSALALAAIIYFSVGRFFYDYRDYEASIKRSQYPLAAAATDTLPPEPRLEEVNRMAGIEKGNVYLREEQQEAILQSYGPVGDGYVHIPIDHAIDLLAGKLPVRPKQPNAEQARRQNGLVDAGEPNSGRMFRGEGHD